MTYNERYPTYIYLCRLSNGRNAYKSRIDSYGAEHDGFYLVEPTTGEMAEIQRFEAGDYSDTTPIVRNARRKTERPTMMGNPRIVLTLEVDHGLEREAWCTYAISGPCPDLGVSEIINVMVRPLLLAAGYHPENVEEAFGEDA